MGGGGGGCGFRGRCPQFHVRTSAFSTSVKRVNTEYTLWCNCGKNCKSIHFARFSDCAAIVTGACQGIGEGILYALRRKNEKVCSN